MSDCRNRQVVVEIITNRYVSREVFQGLKSRFVAGVVSPPDYLKCAEVVIDQRVILDEGCELNLQWDPHKRFLRLLPLVIECGGYPLRVYNDPNQHGLALEFALVTESGRIYPENTFQHETKYDRELSHRESLSGPPLQEHYLHFRMNPTPDLGYLLKRKLEFFNALSDKIGFCGMVRIYNSPWVRHGPIPASVLFQEGINVEDSP